MIRSERKEFPSDVIVETLEGLATSSKEENAEIQLGSYIIIELFKRLDSENIDIHKMQLLEWYYIQLLNDSHNGRPVKYLNKALEESPKFFAEVLSWLYIPENRSPDEEIRGLNKDFISNRAKNANELIDAWNKIPGEDEAGKINLIELKNWILNTIQECKIVDREKKGYYVIGKLLGKARARRNNWPQLEICEVIEEINNESINQGFITGIINGAGIKASIRPATDGSPERATAEHYKAIANKLSTQFPITANLILEVVDHYNSWGRLMDTDEAQRQLED